MINRGTKELIIYACLLMLWCVAPFLTLFLLLLLVLKCNLTSKQRVCVYFLTSLTLALLAFTQKSLSESSVGFSTDVTRYYDAVNPLIGKSFVEAFSYILFVDDLYLFFSFANAVLVVVFKNVQSISFFWTFVLYFLYFLSCNNYLIYRGLSLSRRSLFVFLILSLFGFILFTQVTEILKQAAATSIFFYGLTSIMLSKKKVGYFFVVLSLGIHSTPYFLLFLLFYNRMTNSLLLWLIPSLCFLSFFNVMSLVGNLLPDYGYFALLKYKALGYSEDLDGFSSSIRYVLLMIVVFTMILYRQKFGGYLFRCDKSIYIAYLYFCILLLNYPVAHNFIRFVNMAHFIYAFLFIEILVCSTKFIKLKHAFVMCLSIIFLVTNFQMTRGRTSVGGYSSSYMDNSASKILTTSVCEYIKYKAY